MPWPAIRQTANNDSISRLNSRPKIPFPGNGKGNYKISREGKGNFRLVFPGIMGNGNSRSPLCLTYSESYASKALNEISWGNIIPSWIGVRILLVLVHLRFFNIWDCVISIESAFFQIPLQMTKCCLLLNRWLFSVQKVARIFLTQYPRK